MKKLFIMLLPGVGMLSCTTNSTPAPATSLLLGLWTTEAVQATTTAPPGGLGLEVASTFQPGEAVREFAAGTLRDYYKGALQAEQPYRQAHDTLYIGPPPAQVAVVRSLSQTRLELVVTTTTDGLTTTTTSVYSR